MDQLKLTDEEWKFYAEHFSVCDLEGSGRVPLGRATELFQTASLSAEQLAQVLQVSGAKRVGHFGRSQFYIALRCIALIQSGIALERVSTDSLRWHQFDKDATLPKLERRTSPKADKPPATPTRTSTVSSHAQPPAPPPKFAIRQSTIAEAQPSTAHKPHANLHTQHSLTVSNTTANANTNPTALLSASKVQQKKTNTDWACFEEADEPRVSSVVPPSSAVAAAFAFDDTPQHAASLSQSQTAAFMPLTSSSHGKLASEFDYDEQPDENDAIVQRDESEVLLDTAAHVTDRKFNEEWFQFSENEQAQADARGRNEPSHAAKTNSLDKERMYNAAAFQKRKEKPLGSNEPGKAKNASATDSGSDTDSDSTDESTETEGDANADEADSSDDIYKMTQEQRNYYVDHFLTLVAEPNPKAVLDGAAARAFFLKSNLPVEDLKRIWHLADADLDGALTLEEFCTAMHLTVLRRNGLEIPERLEIARMPYSQLDTEAVDRPDERQPDDAYAHADAQFDEADAGAKQPSEMRFDNQPTFTPNWSSASQLEADSQKHQLAQQSSIGAYSTLTDGDEDSHSGYTTNTEGVQVPRPVQFSDAVPPAHHVSAQPFAIRTTPADAATAYTHVKPSTNKPGGAPFKPPPLPPRKPPHTSTSSSSGPLPGNQLTVSTRSAGPNEDAGAGAHLHPLDDPTGSAPSEMNNEWLHEQIEKLLESKAVYERLNRELNAELQETMEERIALEIQLEHLRRPSLI